MITHAWRIIHMQGDRVLLCLLCDRYSWNMHDIANRYCGFCHEWLDIVPEDYRRMRRLSDADADTIIAQINAREAESLEVLRREAVDVLPRMPWLTFVSNALLTALAWVISWLTLPLLALYARQVRRRKQDP